MIKQNIVFETGRLTLREFTFDDTDFIIRLLNSPGWLEFIGDRNVKTEEQAKNYLLAGPIKSYRENGFGLSMVETRPGKRPIGMCGLLKRDYLENPDIGFAFLPEETGKGFAFEIANATMQHAKDVLKISNIMAITMPGNKPSIRLLEKLGFNFLRMTLAPGGDKDLLLYSH
jgi:RimJ/RimL family protein N-acetyltransferase